MGKFRTPYDGIRFKVAVDFSQATSRTKQSFRDECDINKIMARYAKSGLLTHVARYQGQYADVAAGIDFQSAMNAITDAENMFHTLPARLRARFRNDPGRFLMFARTATPEQLGELGLLPAVVRAGGSAGATSAPVDPTATPAPEGSRTS